MKILHYTLGFEPIRSGGLVGYATDLMNCQKKMGHQVIALYPGKLNVFRRSSYIKQDNKKNILAYQIVNSLPLPLFGGIKDPEKFMNNVSKKLYEEFLNAVSPEIIHVHTLMGIHQEFFEAAKKLKIPIIFTSHDYFGLAPEPKFFFNGVSYDQSNTVEDWFEVSKYALSTTKLRLFQLRVYPFLRKVSRMTKKKSDIDYEISDVDSNKQYLKEFYDLKKYYQEIFGTIDMFHFNSEVAKDVYMNNLNGKTDYKIISITNSSIVNRCERKEKNTGKVKVAYIGPCEDFRGYYDFLSLARGMNQSREFEFHTYGHETKIKNEYVINHGKYSKDNLNTIYDNIDVLIVPSKWKETFGLIVLEALSFNTPVLVSNNVGAKDLLDKSCIFKDTRILKSKLIRFDWTKKNYELKTMKDHCEEILNLYLSTMDMR